jgi:hypothetical protein
MLAAEIYAAHGGATSAALARARHALAAGWALMDAKALLACGVGAWPRSIRRYSGCERV